MSTVRGLLLLMCAGLALHAPAQTWVKLTPIGGPSARGHEPIAGYDPATNRLVVYLPSNSCYGAAPPEVWVLTYANGLVGTPTWSQLQPTGTWPCIETATTGVYDAANNRLIVYGGCAWHCGSPMTDVFVLSNANGLGGTPVWSQSTVTNPNARSYHSLVYDSTNNLAIAFGGAMAYFGTNRNDTSVLSNANGMAPPSTWTFLAPLGTPPGPREMHSAVYDRGNNRMTVFGGQLSVSMWWGGSGYTYDIRPYSDVWVLTNANDVGGAPVWTLLGPPGPAPAARAYHSAVYDAAANRMIVYGGFSFNNITQTYTSHGDVWQLSQANGLGGTPVWSQIFPTGMAPGARHAHAAAFDAATQRMIIFGGFSFSESSPRFSDVWVLELVLTVTIDIKPGSYPNSINLGSNGTVPVAIFSTPSFDARTVIPSSVTLAGASVRLKGNGTPMSSVQDVNGDGLPDLVVHVSTEALQLTASDAEAVLEGQTTDGRRIRGTDTIRVVP